MEYRGIGGGRDIIDGESIHIKSLFVKKELNS